MERISIKEGASQAGTEIKLAGWVSVRRDHGKLIFIDLTDASGSLQVVFTPADKELLKLADSLRPGDVVEIGGVVQPRPESMINAMAEFGRVELQAKKLEILNKSETAPFDINTNGYEIGEEIRLKYRYLDLRRTRLQTNLRMRHKVINFMRNYLSAQGFVEVETPLLTKSTPEGARDYVVPSRLQPGNFYALPQSPQQFKQLLMVAGLEKYFQVAKCLRDEDTRGDRQPEFTQLDIEMSFVDREMVMALNEEMITQTVKNNFPAKKISQIPFPRLSYREVMEQYGTDRPDLRKHKEDLNELAFCWVIDFPFFEKKTPPAEGWTFTHNPFSAAMPEFQEMLMKKKNIEKIIAAQYDLALNGFEIGGGSIRNHQPETLKKVLEIMGLQDKQIEENYGYMLKAFTFGAPPHGGIAYGLDRFLAILLNEPNIREVIAFPKTGDGRDLMMGAPSPISQQQLNELGISLKKKKEDK